MGCSSPNLPTEELFSKPLDENTFMRAPGDRLQQSGEAQKKDALKKVKDSFILPASSLPLGNQCSTSSDLQSLLLLCLPPNTAGTDTSRLLGNN